MTELTEQQEQEMIEKAKAGDPEANYNMSLWALEQAMAEPGEERWNRLAAKCLVKSAEAGYGPAREKMNELLVQTEETEQGSASRSDEGRAQTVVPGAHEAPVPGAHEAPNSVPIEEEEHVPAHAVNETGPAPAAAPKPSINLGAAFAGAGAKAKELFGRARAGIAQKTAAKAPAGEQASSGEAAQDGGKAPLLNFSQWDDAKWKKVQTICIVVCVVLAILIAVLLITGRNKKPADGREEITIPEAEVVITPEPQAPDAAAANPAAPAGESPAPEASEYPTQAILDEIAGANLDVFPEEGDYVTEAKTVTVSTSGSSLNVRRGPAASYEAVSAMENGTSTDVYAYKNGWALVKYDGVWGWCSNEYLK